MNDEELVRKNIRTGLTVLAVIVGMIAVAFASVPLYRLFCQVTGFGGSPKIDPNAVASKVLDQDITIRFNTDIVRGMPWTFRPDQESVTLQIGQTGMVSFYARNDGTETIEGTAIFNVVPEQAGAYFNKTQCFCFGLQSLKPGQEAHMPVRFFIAPEIADDPDLKGVKTLTLSYTFFKADSPALEDALKAYYNSGN